MLYTRFITMRAFGLASCLLLAASSLATAQDRFVPRNPFAIESMVDIEYQPPNSIEAFGRTYEVLQKRRVLEQAQRFLAPLKLRQRLLIRTAECGNSRSYLPYKSGGPVTICYEFVKKVADVAPDSAKGTLGLVGVSRVTEEMAVVGPVVQELLHNVALAVFAIEEVPVWGRAEVAADNVAGFLMLQFGTDVALKTILGTAYFLNVQASNQQRIDLADIRPTVRQRYYGLLCIAYGSDPIKFSAFSPANRDPNVTDLIGVRGLQGYCEDEFVQVRRAFIRTILPIVDETKLKDVLATKWLDD